MEEEKMVPTLSPNPPASCKALPPPPLPPPLSPVRCNRRPPPPPPPTSLPLPIPLATALLSLVTEGGLALNGTRGLIHHTQPREMQNAPVWERDWS